ncbi:MAG: hypothetical protein IPM81_08065 [Saprospirales bacterium]|nr:hypothetical protein [Saprospirales bacterium]
MNRIPNDDDALLRLLKENPQEGFTRLIKAGGGFRFIDRLAADAGIHDSAFIEDIKAETLLALYHNVRTGRLTRLSGKLTTYLYGVAQKILANQLRKNQNEAKRIERFFTIDDTEFELPKWDNTPPDPYELQVKRCLDNLPEECRGLLKKRFLQEKPDYPFLQELFGFASAAVAKQRVYACLEKIRTCVNLISSSMDRDEAAILEILRRFLDDELSPEERPGVASLLRDDPRAAVLLEEEKKIRAALSRIARRDLLDQARSAIGASESSARVFRLPPYRWMLAAAAFAALAVGGWWLFLRQQPGEHPAAAARERRTVFDQRLPIRSGGSDARPATDSLHVTIKEAKVSVTRYTLSATELELESPPGQWMPPPDIRLFRAAPQDSLLLQVNNRLYRLAPTDVQRPLPPPASPD